MAGSALKREFAVYESLHVAPGKTLLRLAEKALAQGQRVVVKTRDESHREDIVRALWLGDPKSFLPHGSVEDGHPDMQPVWVTEGMDNPNRADVWISVDQPVLVPPEPARRSVLLLETALSPEGQKARELWTEASRDADLAATWWIQGADGTWHSSDPDVPSF